MGKFVSSAPSGVLNMLAADTTTNSAPARSRPKPKEKVSLQSFLNAVEKLHEAQHGPMEYCVEPRS